MAQAPHPRMHGLTHVTGGSDPIPGLPDAPGGDTIDAIIMGLAPSGWWKLNESTGIVAADSSGNGVDLTADTGPPVWAQPAGPPGTQTANFETGTAFYPPPSGTLARVARAWAAQTGSFTAGLWVKRNNTTFSNVMGQGNPSRSGGNGWTIQIYNPSTTPANSILFALVNSGSGGGSVLSINPFGAGVWAFVAGTYDATAHVAKLYVNGLLQGTSSTFTFAMSANPLWIGHDAGLGGNAYQGCFCTLSYAFLMPTALSGTNLLNIYNSAAFPGGADAGKALLATGLGSTYWDYALEVTY